MKKIIGTGLSGMLGSCITDVLDGRYEFVDMSYDTGVDIRNKQQLHDYIQKSESDIVLHLAAKADVDACEADKQHDLSLISQHDIHPQEHLAETIQPEIWKNESTAFAINTVGTYNVADVCKELGKKLIYISTDFVFDGTKESEYTESDTPHPLNHYGATKYWGELVLSQVFDNYVIMRITFPYGTHHELKKDFVQIVRDRLAEKKPIKGITDQVFTPTYAPDIAHALDHLINHSVERMIVHAVGSQPLTTYDAMVAIARQFGYDTEIIGKTTADEYYNQKAVRPKHLATSNELLEKRGIHFNTFEEGLKKLS